MVEKRFKVLRFIGTLWKVLALIELILGLLAAIGLLLVGLLGGGLLEQLGRGYGMGMRNMPAVEGALVGIAGFITTAIVAVIYFLLLYAAGELIYLALAVEENTRSVSYSLAAWMQQQPAYPAPTAPVAPAYPPVQPFTPPPEETPPPSPTLPIQR